MKIILLLTGILSAVQIIAQLEDVPKISSQYLFQRNDMGAVVVHVKKDKAYIMEIESKQYAFTQANMYEAIDARYKRLNHDISKEQNLKIVASRHTAFKVIHDLYIWAQIYGFKKILLAVVNDMKPDTYSYLPLDIFPFTKWEEACTYYSSKKGVSSTAIATLDEIHSGSSKLSTDYTKNRVIAKKDIRPRHYIPKNIVHIDVKESGEAVFKGKTINAMALASMVQMMLSGHYNNSYDAAKSQSFLWLNVNFDAAVSLGKMARIISSLNEAYNYYWEELAYNKFMKAYI